MTAFPPDQRRPSEQPRPLERTAEDVLSGRLRRRRERIRAEIHRNRAEPHRVPTWLLAAVLGALVLGWVYLLVTS